MRKFFVILVVLISISFLFADKEIPIQDKARNTTAVNATDVLWDVLLQFDVDTPTGQVGLAGMEWDGTYFYATKWSGSNQLFQFDAAGNYIAPITVPLTGCRDVAHDGTYFYGSPASASVTCWEPTTGTAVPANNINVAGALVRAIGYDEVTDTFWSGNWSDNIVNWDRTGTILGTNPWAGSLYGLAYDNDPDGPFLYAHSQDTGCVAYKLDVNNSLAQLSVMDYTSIGGTGAIAGGACAMTDWDPQFRTLGLLLQGTPDYIVVVELDLNLPLDAPGAPTNVTMTPHATGGLEAMINWTCPTTTVGAGTLTDLDEMRVYRDGTLIYTDTNPTIGAAGSYNDVSVPAAGTVFYSVVGFNDLGEGIPGSASGWVGEDIPAAVTNLTLTDVSAATLVAQLDWTNPTTGFHGGYFNGVAGYEIERSDGALFNVAGSMTTWQDTTVPAAGVYCYTVTPFNGSGLGPSTTSAQVGIGVSIVQIGNAEITDYHIPMNIWYDNSIVECVYDKEWLGSGMLINTISFHAAITSTVPAFNLEIWMGEVDVDDLSGGWLNDSQLTMVYDGTIAPPPGDSWIDLPLDTPFEYTYTENLVIGVIKDDDEYYSTADTWWTTESGTASRTLHQYNDTEEFSIQAPPTASNAMTSYPDVRFYWSPLDYGDVEGVVTDSDTSNPISGVEVYVGSFGPATTNAAGEYLVEDVVVGTQSVTAFKDGYYDFVGSLEVFASQVNVYDFAMDPTVNGILDGTVTDSDTGNPLVGAEIYAIGSLGYEFDAVTNASGFYEINNIIVDTYDVYCSFPDYPTGMVENVVIQEGLTTTVDFSLEGYTYWNNFESNDGGLVSNNAGGWQWGAFTSGPMAGYSGSNGWGTVIGGDYPASANFTLDTPVSYAIGSPVAMLEFWHWYDIESSWDGGNVKISTDNGSTWDIITPLTGYPGVGNTSNPLSGEPIFCNTVPGNFWQLAQFDLSAYVGQSVMFRWHFGSDSSVQYPGWYIDDIAISGGSAPDPGWIDGLVTLDGGTGDVEDVIITAGYASTSPDASGNYSLEVIPGTYDVTATLAGYVPFLEEDVVVVVGQTTDLDITLSEIPPVLYPPENLAVDNMTGMLTWDEPSGGASGEIYYHSGYDNNGIGTSGVVDFICCARFTATELADYYGSTLTGVNIFLHSMDFSYVGIKVYEGGSVGNPGTVVYDQDITGSAIALDWTNHVLTTPVTLVAGNEYWIGYDLSATADHPAAVDAGPMVPDKGGWLYYSGAWDTLAGLGLDYNWVITGIIGSGGDAVTLTNGSKPEKSVESTRAIPVFTEATFEAEFSRTVSRKLSQVVDNTRELTGYNVYLGTTLQGNTDDTFWQLTGLVNGTTYTASVEAVYDEGVSEPVDITFTYQGTGTGNILPLVTELNGNYPNPFNPTTQIKFSIHEQANVLLTIYNVKGQLVRTLVNEQMEPNQYQVVWNGTDNANKPVSSGVYFYKMKANKFVSTKKMILMK